MDDEHPGPGRVGPLGVRREPRRTGSPLKTKDDTIDILVTCPQCAHTHTLKINESDLPNPDGSSRRERYYKLSELQKILSVSRPTLKRWIYMGQIKAVKQGSRKGGAPWYVSESELRKFREQHNR